MRIGLLVCWFSIMSPYVRAQTSGQSQHYLKYHQQVMKVELLIADDQFDDALELLEKLFLNYDFVFLRDYKVAAQLALYLNDRDKSFHYIRKGIISGWGLKAIKKNKYLKTLQNDSEWLALEKAYPDLRKEYLKKIDLTTRKKVQEMSRKDQWKALGALFRIGDPAQERYGIRKFAPHSEGQIESLITIMKNQGYPGERLIGNDFWMSTIISHHNSIATEYVKKDTLYKLIRPTLLQAIDKGEISPYEFAIIDDWRLAVLHNRKLPGYGFLNSPKKETLSETNQLRLKVGLRTVEMRNKLVDIEHRTGISFYLPDWIDGKIKIR